jgi:uncharacterized protein (DUF433 family)
MHLERVPTVVLAHERTPTILVAYRRQMRETDRRQLCISYFSHWPIVLGQKEKCVTDNELLERIAVDPAIMVGKPVIRGTRLTVEFILNLLAHGATVSEIVEEYEGLTPADIQACLLFATKSMEDVSFMPLKAAG